MIARETGVRSDEKVAKINRVSNSSVARIYSGEESFHFSDGVASDHSDEIVAFFHAVYDTSGDGVNVFEDTCIFDTFNVVRNDGVSVLRHDSVSESLGALRVRASDSEVRWAVKGDFLSMTRSADDEDTVSVHAVTFNHIVRYEHIIVRDNTFYRIDDEFVADIDVKFSKVVLEVRRRHDEQQRVAFRAYLVDIAGEINSLDVEIYVG